MILAIAGIAVILSMLAGLLLVRARTLMENEIRERLRSTAAAAALQFDEFDFDAIHDQRDMKKPEFRDAVAGLRAIRETVPNIRFAYIMRRTKDPNMLSFIADADSLLTPAERDANKNGRIDPSEVPSLPGDSYDVSNLPAMNEAFLHPTVDTGINTDQWGSLISGYAPIVNRNNGTVVAILGIDMDARDYLLMSRNILSPAAFVFLFIAGGAIGSYLLLSTQQRRLKDWKRLDQERVGLMLLTYHQLGEPLSIFKWSLESLQDRDPGQTAEQAIEVHVKNMESGIRRMDQMINDLKQAALVQEGRVEFHPSEHDLRPVLERVVAEFISRNQTRRQRIDVQSDSLCFIFDDVLVATVLRQLLLNATGYSPDGSAIIVKAQRRGRKAEVSVADAGYGIPKKDQERMFSKFARGSNAGKIQPDGNGLGLFIARGLIERAGGEIGMESTEGEGATFTFRLPMQ